MGGSIYWHLRKLVRHPWRDSRNLSIRPVATPRGGVFLGVLSHEIAIHLQKISVKERER